MFLNQWILLFIVFCNGIFFFLYKYWIRIGWSCDRHFDYEILTDETKQKPEVELSSC